MIVGVVLVLAAGLGAAVLALITSVFGTGDECGSPVGASQSAGGPGTGIVLAPPGTAQQVGATEYGGPGDPSSGVIGSSGANLLDLPDSYAELGGDSFQTATAMGGLPYLTPLRISWGSALRDRLQARYRARRRPGRRPAPRPRPLVGAGRAARDSLRERAVVRSGRDRAPAPGRRRGRPRAGNRGAGRADRPRYGLPGSGHLRSQRGRGSPGHRRRQRAGALERPRRRPRRTPLPRSRA